MSEHTAMQDDVRALTNLYNQSREVAADLQDEVDQLRTELATATARADALDVRCSAAERLATVVASMPGFEPDNVEESNEFAAAMELWKRVDASHHGTRAHYYADAVTQLAQARRRVPALEPDDWAHVEREAAHWKQSVPEWLSDSITQYLSEYGQVK